MHGELGTPPVFPGPACPGLVWSGEPRSSVRARSAADSSLRRRDHVALFRVVPLGLRDQRRHRQAERRGDPTDVDQADVALPSLDIADVGAVEPDEVSEVLLRQAALAPQLPDGGTERRSRHCLRQSHKPG